MAEKLGINCAFGNGAAIDGNVLGMLARRVLVDDFRKEFLARAGLSGDEDAQVYRGNAYGACYRLGKGGGVADDAEAKFGALHSGIVCDSAVHVVNGKYGGGVRDLGCHLRWRSW